MTDKCYGKCIPGIRLSELRGRLIVIEGGDGAGRSTQMALLKVLLERKGYPAIGVGLKRSKLLSKELTQVMRTNVLCARTLALLYASDFADQYEQVVIPSLRAGFVVIADRYIYTLMARSIVRGADPEWIKGVYQIALIPDLIISLRVSPRMLAERTFLKRRMVDYWESGQDIERAGNLYEGFIKYQSRVQKIFRSFEEEYGFNVVDGEGDALEVHKQIEGPVLELLSPPTILPAPRPGLRKKGGVAPKRGKPV